MGTKGFEFARLSLQMDSNATVRILLKPKERGFYSPTESFCAYQKERDLESAEPIEHSPRTIAKLESTAVRSWDLRGRTSGSPGYPLHS
jgi:hypothetical protein